jgi:CheY-like chemotaxis protein
LKTQVTSDDFSDKKNISGRGQSNQYAFGKAYYSILQDALFLKHLMVKKQLNVQKLDLILMDIQMPHKIMDIRQLRNQTSKKYNNIPIIALTAGIMLGKRKMFGIRYG